MVKIYLYQELLNLDTDKMGIFLYVEESDLQEMIRIAKSNKLDITILFSEEK